MPAPDSGLSSELLAQSHMMSLFDKFTPTTTSFQPRTTTELFALKLAQKLGDGPAVRHYVALADHYSEAQLLHAYRKTLRGPGNGDRGVRFRAELERVHTSGVHDRQTNLLAIRVERRAVAAAIFHGDHLEHADARQFSSSRDKALASAIGFINWTLERFSVESVALESIPTGHEFHRRALHDAICKTLRDQMLPIWEIPKAVLLDSYGHPALRFRAQLREAATTIWPILAGTHAKVFIQDAALLGLHVQIDRGFLPT